MRFPPSEKFRICRGFTLVELLVAITVLVLVVVMLAQMTGAMASAINRGSGQLDAVSKARFAFDRLGIDIERAVHRSDVGDAFSKLQGNDEMKFYCSIKGYSGTREVSLVHYRVNPATYQLERGVWGTLWNSTDTATEQNKPLVFGTSAPPPLPNSTDYEVLGQGIFRMEFYWLLKPSGTQAFGGLTTDPHSLGSSDVAALVVRLAVVDGKSMNLLKQNTLAVLASATPFPDLNMTKTNSPNSPQPWTSSVPWTVNVNALGLLAIPLPVAQSIRVFERTYYVDP